MCGRDGLKKLSQQAVQRWRSIQRVCLRFSISDWHTPCRGSIPKAAEYWNRQSSFQTGAPALSDISDTPARAQETSRLRGAFSPNWRNWQNAFTFHRISLPLSTAAWVIPTEHSQRSPEPMLPAKPCYEIFSWIEHSTRFVPIPDTKPYSREWGSTTQIGILQACLLSPHI